MVPALAPLRSASRERRVRLALLAIAAGALALRLHALGNRVFYYDEAWFGYWTLRYVETGVWSYRPVLHGPLFARVNAVVLPALGAGDAAARLVVAVLGGLLPLSAWLFREHLRDVEVVSLAALLAVSPVLVYYSRFMRKDVPLAAAMLVALGLFVRAHDTGRARYLYAAGAALGVAFATKESVLLWLLAWLGAGALLADRRLRRARSRSPSAVLRAGLGRIHVRRWAPHAVGAGLVCLAVVVYCYAPRSPGLDRPGLWTALAGEYGTLPAVVEAATVGSLRKALAYWAAGSIQRHPYLPYLADTLRTLSAGALAVSLLGVVGFLADRYSAGPPRDLVAFNAYAGLAAVVGYPLANNFPVPWSTVHAVVPLAVPAAVGVGVVADWGRGGRPAGDGLRVGTDGGVVRSAGLAAVPPATVRSVVAAGLLVLLAANAAGVVATTSFASPHESPAGDPGSELVYYAQAPADLEGPVEAIRRAAATGGGDVDVLYVGPRLAMDESRVDRPPATDAWHARMPLPWYTEAAGADVRSVRSAGAIEAPPPVVVTTPDRRAPVARRLGDAYEGHRHRLDDVGDRTVVVFRRR